MIGNELSDTTDDHQVASAAVSQQWYFFTNLTTNVVSRSWQPYQCVPIKTGIQKACSACCLMQVFIAQVMCRFRPLNSSEKERGDIFLPKFPSPEQVTFGHPVSRSKG